MNLLAPRRSAAPYGVAAPDSGILLTSPRRGKIGHMLGPIAVALIVMALLLGAFILVSMFFPR